MHLARFSACASLASRLLIAAFSLVFVGQVHAQASVSSPSQKQTLLAAADDITRQVAALRGLKPLRAFAKGVLSREQIGAKLRERIAKEYTAEEIHAEELVLKRLGLLPADVDYLRLLTDILMEQVAGFYDPQARQLYIADWIGDAMQRPAMAHEIEHALQDQHFDLKALTGKLKDNGDGQLARAALIEGDGTAVMLEFVLQRMGWDLSRLPEAALAMGPAFEQLATSQPAEAPLLAAAPSAVRETLMFPYFAGLRFVMSLRKQRPWSGINDVFRHPPDSTEQVMHPEKYVARERPLAIVAGPLTSLKSQREVYRDVLGEYEWQVLLAAHLPKEVAERAAAGWGGDRLVAYRRVGEGAVSVASFSAWDSEEDAREIEGALRRWLASALSQREPESSFVGPVVYQARGEAWSVERRDRRVLAWFGIAAERHLAATDEVWAKWKVVSSTSKSKSRPDKRPRR